MKKKKKHIEINKNICFVRFICRLLDRKLASNIAMPEDFFFIFQEIMVYSRKFVLGEWKH